MRTQDLGTHLLIQVMEISHLSIVHALIVDLRQCIELSAQFLIMLTFLLIIEQRQPMEVDILWMKGEDTDARIRIGVGPRVGDGCVIDRQHLQDLLSCGTHKVDHLFQVTEVSYAERLFRTEGKDGDERASDTCVVYLKESLTEVIDHNLTWIQCRYMHRAVQTVFPQHIFLAFVTHRAKLKLYGVVREPRGVKIDAPLVVVVLRHRKRLCQIPVAKVIALTDEHEAGMSKLWSPYDEPNGPCKRCLCQGLHLTGTNAVGESRTVEIGVLRDVVPLVIDRILVAISSTKL